MILRVDIRGDGLQLGQYMHHRNENDYIEILEVDGREDATPEYLEQVILSMELNAELTKSPNKPFFHAQINPAYGEDKAMTRGDWYLAADILAKGTGYENQRRVITLHTKKGRTHAHVVWERYIHATGKMVDNKNSKYKADAMRPVMEQALGHKLTPHRNPHRFDLKETATEIWNRTNTGAEFIKEARKAGYMVAAGIGNRPFIIVDSTGRAFDLVRQLQGVRTKEVRARLRSEPLIKDKQAIDLMREQSDNSGKREKQQLSLTPAKNEIAQKFADNRGDAMTINPVDDQSNKLAPVFDEFKTESDEITTTKPDDENKGGSAVKVAVQFARNKDEVLTREEQRQTDLQKIIDTQNRIRERQEQKKRYRHR